MTILKKTALITSSIVILTFSICLIIYIAVNFKVHKDMIQPPTIVLKDLSQTKQTIDFTQKPTVLLFFTSWCPYCNEDAPKITSLYDKYKKDINIYGMNILNRDDLEEVQRYVDTHRIQYPVLLDETGYWHKQYGGSGFPSLYFINKQGQVVDQIIGSTSLENLDQAFDHFKQISNS